MMQALNAKQISLKNERKKAVAAINATADALQLCDEILKSLASGTKTVTPLLVSKYSDTSAQQASCHQASYIHSNIPHINHSLARIANQVS